jgi:sarcosine oxidase/L-pipecolate oxidase
MHLPVRNSLIRLRDAITPNQDFVITSHPRCDNLFIATTGSFHGWKFLPTIGSYVVDLLDGKLDPALVKRWAWDRENEGAAQCSRQVASEARDERHVMRDVYL